MDNINIKYTVKDIDKDELSYITLSIQQIEGSIPSFYKQLKSALGIRGPIEIVNRRIVNE